MEGVDDPAVAVGEQELQIVEGQALHHRGQDSQEPPRPVEGLLAGRAHRMGQLQTIDFKLPEHQKAAHQLGQCDPDMQAADAQHRRGTAGLVFEADIRRRQPQRPRPFDLEDPVDDQACITKLRNPPDRQSPVVVAVHCFDGHKYQDEAPSDQQAGSDSQVFEASGEARLFQVHGPCRWVSGETAPGR